MNTVLRVLLAIVISLAIAITGMGFGILYQQQKMVAVSGSLLGVMQAKPVRVITVMGKITEAWGNSLMVASQGETVPVVLADDTQIVLQSAAASGPSYVPPTKGSLSDLQIGKSASISAKVNARGEIEARIIRILQ